MDGKRKFTPETIDELKANEVFVFGSNCNGNHYGGGEYYPACRMRKKGNKEWKWYPCNSAKPLFWMPIPHIPTKAGVAVYKKYYNETEKKS